MDQTKALGASVVAAAQPAESPPLKAPDPVLPPGALEDKVASTAASITQSVPPAIVPVPEPEDVLPRPEPDNIVPTPEPDNIVPNPELREIIPNPDPTEIVPIPEPDDIVPISELPESVLAAPAMAAQPAAGASAYRAQPPAIVPVSADLLAIHEKLAAPLATAERSSVRAAESPLPSRSSSLEASSFWDLIDALSALNLSQASATRSLGDPSPASPSLNEAASAALDPSTAATRASSVPSIDLARETLYEPSGQAQPSFEYWPNAVMSFRPTIVDRPPMLILGMGSTSNPEAPASLPGNPAAAPISAPASFSLFNAGAPGSAAPNLASLTLVTAWRTLWPLASLRPPPVCLSSLTPPG